MSSQLQDVFAEQVQNLSTLHRDLDEQEKGNQYLSFTIGGEFFAVNILSVQEIRGWERTTFLPNSPFYIKGVLNLRGTIVPVMDLRSRFAFNNPKYSKNTVIIILKVESGLIERLMGCVVDGVSDVFNAEESSIAEVPDYNSGVDSRFTAGVMTIENNAITLLEPGQLLCLDLIEHPYTGAIDG